MIAKSEIDHLRARVEVEVKSKGWSLSDLARAMELSPQALHEVLKRGKPTDRTLERIAEALGCPIERLAEQVTPREYGEAMIPQAN